MIVKIQNRRGQYVDFDPSKLLPGEFAIVQTGDPNTADGKAIYIGVTAGNVKQLATLDELQSEVETALQSAIPEVVEEATQEAQDAADRAEAAAQTLEIDTTLTETGQAAEAKATGDAIDELNERIGNLSDLETEDKTDIVSAINEAAKSGITDEVKTTLLACFEKVAWVDEDGQDYYNALYNALYGQEGFPKIVATFVGGARTVYTDDPLTSLKNNITVKYYENAQDETGTVVSNYNITGELINGDSLLTIDYDELSTNIIVPCTSPKNRYTYTNGDMVLYKGGCNSWDPGNAVYPPFFETNSSRRSFYTQSGSIQFRLKPGNTLIEGEYPFHIPAEATSVTVSVTPATMQVAVNAWVADFANNRYWYIDQTDSGYKTGSVTQSIPKVNIYSKVRALAVILKYNSSGSTFSKEPTELTISFS